MRKTSTVALMLAVITLATLAVSQTVVTNSGYATMAAPAGVAPTMPPLLSTPQIAFVNVSPAAVGATNATGNNIAGARNATVSNVPGMSYASTTVPVLINPETAPPHAPEAEAGATTIAEPPEGAELAQAGFIDVGVVASADMPSVAEMAREARERERMLGQVRTYTNHDIERVAQRSGISKPSGMTVPTP